MEVWTNLRTKMMWLAVASVSLLSVGRARSFPAAAVAMGIGASRDLKLEAIKPSFYAQFQWRDVQSGDSGFAFRRSRLGLTYSPLESTSIKLSVEMSTGSNRIDPELKDLVITHKISPETSLAAGQMSLPLGYEIERSSSNREMPERSLYNRRLFSGERNRGVQIRHSIDSGWLAHAGVWNGLTIGDPQAGDDVKLGITLGARREQSNHSYGISAFIGSRPGIAMDGEAAQKANRLLVYLDCMYAITSGLTARAEVMIGKDRDPLGGETPTFNDETSVLGYHVQLSYLATPTSQFTVKYENYDPDTGDGVSMNRAISQFGLAYTYHINELLKLSFSWEHPNEQGTEKRNDIITIRSQFKI